MQCFGNIRDSITPVLKFSTWVFNLNRLRNYYLVRRKVTGRRIERRIREGDHVI